MHDLDLSAHLSDSLCSRLSDELAKGARVSEALVSDVADALGGDMGAVMILLLPIAARFARTPLSHFNVGAVAQGSSTGALYLGSNMEFPGQALSFSVHGEQSATMNAWMSGERGLRAIAVNAAPCGYCRQFLHEIATEAHPIDILMRSGDGALTHSRAPHTDYLPQAFGPSDLGITGGMMAPQSHGMQLASASPLAQAALDAANTSYAPYTGNHSGVALQTADGAIYAGRYGENAAYSPSMSPLASALAYMNMSRPAGAPYEITAAALVEAAAAPISQKGATLDVLSVVAPKIALEYHAVR